LALLTHLVERVLNGLFVTLDVPNHVFNDLHEKLILDTGLFRIVKDADQLHKLEVV
jgi:hypothetical protein